MVHSGPPEIGRLTRPGFKDSSTIIPARLDRDYAFCIIIAPLGPYCDLLSMSWRSSPEKFRATAKCKGQVHEVNIANVQSRKKT